MVVAMRGWWGWKLDLPLCCEIGQLKGIEPRSECKEFTGYDTFTEYAPFTD